MTTQLTVPKVISDEDIATIHGEFLTLKPTTKVINYDADVYREDGTPLLHFRKNRISQEDATFAFNSLKKAGKVKNNNRGVASGKFDIDEFLKTHKNAKREDVKIQKGGFNIYYDFHNDAEKKDNQKAKLANYANSGVVGWLDAPNRMRPEEGGCRLTSFSSKNMKTYEKTFSFFQSIDKVFKELEPERHAEQLKRTKLSKAQVADTAFSTITVNYNWRTALHTDKGDYERGIGCFSVAENLENKESFGGCELIFPQFDVAVDVRHGDVLLFDSHQWHCNNEAVFGDNNERLSFVCYLRVNMLSACSKQNPYTEKQCKGFKIQYRPDSKDEGAIEDVCDRQMYKTRKFKVGAGDVWLDCGAHIGCFTNWALKMGVDKVIAVEANPENLKVLTHNMYLNVNEGKTQIIHAAVRYEVPDEKEQVLWLATSTRRHTTFPVRGRESVQIPYIKFEDLLTDEITAVKLNIQGDEREILQNVRDWKNVEKLVFEYHFTKKKNDQYNTLEKFHEIMNHLREQGFDVMHKKLELTGVPNYFPADQIVHCIRTKKTETRKIKTKKLKDEKTRKTRKLKTSINK